MKKGRTGKHCRSFAVFLCMCILLTIQPEIWNSLSVSAAEESGTRVVLSIAELSEEIKGQTVHVGTGYEELNLPKELTVFIGQAENSSTPGTEENADGENAEEPEAVTKVTWQSEPEYDGSAEGIYIFTAVLPEGYILAKDVRLPEIMVTVENSTDAVIQAQTEKQQAEIPETEPKDLNAWVEPAGQISENITAIAEAQEMAVRVTVDGVATEYADFGAAWTAAQNADSAATITLLKDITYDDTAIVLEGKNIIFEGGQWQITFTKANSYSIMVKADGVFTLKSGTLSGPSTFFYIYNSGTANIAGGVVNASREGCRNYGTVVMSGGKVAGSTNASSGLINNSGIINGGDLTITGGEISGYYGVSDSRQSSNIIIEGGSISGSKYGLYVNTDSNVLLSGGTFFSTGEAAVYLEAKSNKKNVGELLAEGYSYFNAGGIKIATQDAAQMSLTEEVTVGQCTEHVMGTVTSHNELTHTGGCAYCGVEFAEAHTEFSYAADGAVIQQSCAACAREIATATLFVANGADLNYTGNEMKPVQVAYSDRWVEQGDNKPDDNAIIYTNNINAGTATAELTISGAAASLDFTISACGIDGAVVTLNSDTITYNGFEQTKEVSNVTVNGRKLTPGTDYAVSGNTGKDAGDYKIIITGKGNYGGTKEVSFNILPALLTADMVTIASGPYYYTKNPICPAVTVQFQGSVLPGAAYTVAYADNVNPGTANVTVKGTGNYTGIIEKTFTIVCRQLPSGGSLTDYISISPLPNDNGWYNSGITLTPKDGCGVGETPKSIGGSALVISGETGTDGETKTIYIKDSEGNIYQTEFVFKLDKTPPVFDGNLSVKNHTQEGGDITFTSSEGGKVYWVVSDTGTAPNAQEVKDRADKMGGAQVITGKEMENFTIKGLTHGEKHTVYVVLEDAAGNLSEVKEASFTTLQKAPEITLNDIVIDHEKETVKLSEGIREVEVYTNPDDPSGSRIQPEAGGFLPVEPGTSIYIRYPEKTDAGQTTPASDSTKIDIPKRPAAPAPKQTAVTDTTVTVISPAAGEEYILVEKGSLPEGAEPDWDNTDIVNENGKFTGLVPNKKYDLYVRKKATESVFASGSLKTEVQTYVTIEEPAVTGEGAGKAGNTVLKPDTPDADGHTATFTGTYGEEYTPVITIDGQMFIPGESTPGSEMIWDEDSGKGEWAFTYEIPDGVSAVQITVEFKKRTVIGMMVEPGILKIYADDAANESLEALTAYLNDHCNVWNVYDNSTKGTVREASFTTADNFEQKGATYHYTVFAGGRTCEMTLTVRPVTASVQSLDALVQRQKDDGYTAQEVNAWLPTQVTVTYTGTDYKTRTEKRTVTWGTDSLGTDFGKTLGEQTVNGTVELPAWATGQACAGIVIRFVDKTLLSDGQIQLDIQGFCYGAQKLPGTQGSITVEDTNPVYTYLYSVDGGITWITEENLPKSDGGYIVPGEYSVKVTYTGDKFFGEKTASFTVARKQLKIRQGTLAVEDKNYDKTLTAVLKGNGEAELFGMLEGDAVTLGGTLEARFTEAGPKKDIPVTVTGFLLEGADSGYYELDNTTLTLHATINNADGTPPSAGADSGDDNNDDDENGSDNDNNESGTPTVTPPAATVAPPANKPQPPAQTNPQKQPQPTDAPDSQPENKQESTTTPQPTEKPSEMEKGQTIPASVDNGKIAVSGEPVATGSVEGMTDTSTVLKVGNGAVVVTVVCAEHEYTAGVADTVAVANAVLTTEQLELINHGETIEIRIDVKDISNQVPEQDKKIIENGIKEYQEEAPGLVLGMYVDISLFIKIGEGDWNAITEAREPIEIIIGIPLKLREKGRTYYIIRAHGGIHTFMNDMDDNPDTITVSTELFSSYAIAYVQMEETGHKCSLCHICPTFLGICCFLWLAVIILIIMIASLIQYKRKEQD